MTDHTRIKRSGMNSQCAAVVLCSRGVMGRGQRGTTSPYSFVVEDLKGRYRNGQNE